MILMNTFNTQWLYMFILSKSSPNYEFPEMCCSLKYYQEQNDRFLGVTCTSHYIAYIVNYYYIYFCYYMASEHFACQVLDDNCGAYSCENVLEYGV